MQQATDLTSKLLARATDVSSILQLAAYLGAIAAWAYVAPTLKRLGTAKTTIEGLARKDQIEALKVLFGPIPTSITPDQWIRDRRQRLLLVGFIATLVALVIGVLSYLK